MPKAPSKLYLFVVALLVFAGCSIAEDQVLSDSQFVMLYVDLSFAAEQFLSDSALLHQVQDSIFEAHNVTRDNFNAYKTELDKSPERWSGIWEMIDAELRKREEALKKEKLPENNTGNAKD